MSNYDRLLSELHAAGRRRQPDFDPASIADHQRELRKAVGDMRRLADSMMPRTAKPPKQSAPMPAETMLKAKTAFESGRITGDQLRGLEVAQHHLADAMARGAR